jgi:hypothetical protein
VRPGAERVEKSGFSHFFGSDGLIPGQKSGVNPPIVAGFPESSLRAWHLPKLAPRGLHKATRTEFFGAANIKEG